MDKNILIIEDDQLLLQTVADVFTKDGFQVLTAKDGEEGLMMALQNKPSIILLDVNLPKKSGLTVMKEIRNEKSWGEAVPIIIMSNVSTTDTILNDVSDLHPAFYLQKTEVVPYEILQKVYETLHLV